MYNYTVNKKKRKVIVLVDVKRSEVWKVVENKLIC